MEGARGACMNSHAVGPNGIWRQLQDNAACTLADTPIGCPRMPTPGHGRSHHTHLAAGPKMRWKTHSISGALVPTPRCYRALLE